MYRYFFHDFFPFSIFYNKNTGVQRMLPQMAFSIFQEFAEEVHSATFALTKPDTEVAQYVEKLEALSELKANEASLNERYSEIDALYDLVGAHGIEVPDFEAAAVTTLATDFDALKNAIEEVRVVVITSASVLAEVSVR